MRILRRLFQGQAYSPLGSAFRESLATIAKRVGVDEDTVRHRLKRFQESGFLPDWRLYVNPRIWAGGQVSLWADVDATVPKRPLVEELRTIPGVIAVHTFYDGLAAFVEYDEEWILPETIRRIRDVAGGSDAFVARTAFPAGPIPLSERDWALIRAIRENPWRPYADIAAEVGLSVRTTRARLTRIFELGALFAWPAINFRALEGGVFVHLVTWYALERKAELDEAVAGLLESGLWHTLHLLPYRPGDLCPCTYHLRFPNVPEAQAALARVLRVPGVERARLYLNEDVFTFFDAYATRLDRMLMRTPAATPAVLTRGRPNRARAPEPG